MRGPADARAQRARRARRRIIAGGVTASALLGWGASEAAAAPAPDLRQASSAPVEAGVTLSAVSASGLSVGATALGNVIAAETVGYTSRDSQLSTGPVNAGVVLNDVQASGDSVVQAQAGANSEQIVAPQGGVLQSVQVASDGSATPTSARVQIGAPAAPAQSFGGSLAASASAFSNLVSFDASNGQVSTGAGAIDQSSSASVAAALTIANATFNGPVTGSATAAGDEIDLDQAAAAGGSGTIGELNATQANTGAETASASLTGVRTSATGNAFATSAVGNVLNAGDVVGPAALAQTNGGPQTARTELDGARLNGAFTVQAVGNQAILANNSAIGLHQQNDASQVAEVVSNAGLVLNGATTMQAVALGNNFSGTIAPTELAGQGQQVNSGFQTASISLTGATSTGAGPISLTAVAIGNAATLSAPNSGFVQANYTGGLAAQTATVTLANCTFSNGSAVSTTAQGNLITIRH